MSFEQFFETSALIPVCPKNNKPSPHTEQTTQNGWRGTPGRAGGKEMPDPCKTSKFTYKAKSLALYVLFPFVNITIFK